MKRLCGFLLILMFVLASCTGEAETYTCTFSISCEELVGSELLDENKRELVPVDGYVFPTSTVTFTEGESVFDVLARVCREQKIHLEYSKVPGYGTSYIEGIANIYEFDAGELSGWVYTVNGESVNYGSSSYILKNGDIVKWNYTVDGIR